MSDAAYQRLRLDALFVELDEPDGDVQALVRAAAERTVLRLEEWRFGPPLRDPDRGSRVGIELFPPEGARIAPHDAWSMAHALATELPRGRVEPLFAGDVELEALIGAREESSLAAAGEPPSDVRWHLAAIRLAAAHAHLKAREVPLGGGVLIGHPDTGFTRHPDVLGDDGPILPARGKNLLSPDDPPLDPRSAGVLKQPGHGTATASVIVARPSISVRRRTPPGDDVDLLGVAPDARIAPFRVTETVIILGWQRRLAEAIEQAVDAGCAVLSISLGGLGGSRLDRAIRYAESKGVIIAAAAGNVVPFVVAPATNPLVVACAAACADETPWPGSARGSAVDITAPGHHVWVAGWDEETAVAYAGSGTSFATAAVAGAAALWLSAHRTELAGRTAEIPRLFRRALRETARPVTALPSSKYGAGLLDCEALVRAPLPDLNTEAIEAGLEPSSQAYAVRALLESESESASAARSAADLARGLDPSTLSELGFHLLLDPDLRAAWSRGARTEATAIAPPIPSHASPRLRHMLKTLALAPPPPAPPAPPPLAPPPPAPPRALSPPPVPPAPRSGEAEIKIVIELDIRVRVERGP